MSFLRALTGALTVLHCMAPVAGAVESASRRQTPLAFRDISVVSMTDRGTLRHQSVVVEGATIKKVGPVADVAIPAGARIIEGAAKFLAPGLVDLHVHLFSPDDLIPYLASGVTTVLNMDGSPDHLRWKSDVDEGRLIGPRILSAGPTIDGLPPLNGMFLTAETPEQGRGAVREQKRAGYDFIKLYGTLRPPVFEAILDEAQRQGIPVAGHINRQVGALEALKSSQALAAHAEDLLAARFNEPPAQTDLVAFATAVGQSGMAVTANLSIGPTVIAQLEDLGAVLRSEDAKLLSAAANSQWLPSNNRNPAGENTQGQIASLKQTQDLLRSFVLLLHERRVLLVLGTDSASYGFPGVSAHHELVEMVRAGIPPLDALRSATSNPGALLARVLPRAPRIGSISPGASADLLLLTSDPSAAVESLRTREAVVVRGRLFERAELEALAAAQTRRNAEAKELADHVDALLESRRLTEAGPLFTQLERAERPGVAEWVLWAKHKKLGPEARAAAIIIAELATRLYPQSFSAEYELANLLFAAGQATQSRRHVARSLELAPSNAASQNLSEKLRLSERPLEFDPRGIYVLRPNNVVQSGEGEFRVEITDDSPRAGRITGPMLSDAPLTEVFAAADRLWLSAQSASGPVELRLTVESGSVRGYFASPFGRNGTLEGTKNR